MNNADHVIDRAVYRQTIGTDYSKLNSQAMSEAVLDPYDALVIVLYTRHYHI